MFQRGDCDGKRAPAGAVCMVPPLIGGRSDKAETSRRATPRMSHPAVAVMLAQMRGLALGAASTAAAGPTADDWAEPEDEEDVEEYADDPDYADEPEDLSP